MVFRAKYLPTACPKLAVRGVKPARAVIDDSSSISQEFKMMDVLKPMHDEGHEEVMFVHDADAGLRAIIAIHSTVLGPALGGTRMYPYASEEQALRDVLELSRGMTYKAAAAGLDLEAARPSSSAILGRQHGGVFSGRFGRLSTTERICSIPARMSVRTRAGPRSRLQERRTIVGGLTREHGGGGRSVTGHCLRSLPGHESVRGQRWGRVRRSAADGSQCRAWGKVGWHLACRLLHRPVPLSSAVT